MVDRAADRHVDWLMHAVLLNASSILRTALRLSKGMQIKTLKFSNKISLPLLFNFHTGLEINNSL